MWLRPNELSFLFISFEPEISQLGETVWLFFLLLLLNFDIWKQHDYGIAFKKILLFKHRLNVPKEWNKFYIH